MRQREDTQYKRIDNWFREHETLTRYQALKILGIWEAPARISEMKRDHGYEFETTLKQGVSKSGYTFQSAVWKLTKRGVLK